MPGVTMTADQIITLFADKTIQPHDLAALLGAHTTSQQFFVDKTKAGYGQDSTPGVWDVGFYNETLQPGAASKVFKFQSDLVTANDSRVSDEWHAFIGDQSHWNSVSIQTQDCKMLDTNIQTRIMLPPISDSACSVSTT